MSRSGDTLALRFNDRPSVACASHKSSSRRQQQQQQPLIVCPNPVHMNHHHRRHINWSLCFSATRHHHQKVTWQRTLGFAFHVSYQRLFTPRIIIIILKPVAVTSSTIYTLEEKKVMSMPMTLSPWSSRVTLHEIWWMQTGRAGHCTAAFHRKRILCLGNFQT